MGYTPLFDTLLNGTMFGKWPHNGIWALLLSRASREGVINEVPESLAAHIGIPVAQLMESIRYFMEPDPDSRTPDDEGRRLELLDPSKSWGWRIVNHGKYREKARKKAYDETRTETGADAERKRQQREAQERVPTRPDASRAGPLSSPTPTPNAEAEANTFDVISAIKLEYPRGIERGDHWILAERAAAKLLDSGASAESLVAAAKCYREQQEACGTIGSESILRPSNFFTTGAWRGPFPLPTTKNGSISDRLKWRPDPEEERRAAEGS